MQRLQASSPRGPLLAIGRKQKYFPCRDIATEPNEEFRFDPEDYAAAEDLGEVIGIVHSHPDESTTMPKAPAWAAQDLNDPVLCADIT